MRIKFLATWGLLLSSAVGSPMPRPEPKPEPKPVPMPVPGGAMSTQDDPLNNAHKIAIAALVAGTCLTVVTTLYNEYLAKYASRAQVNEKAVQAQFTAFNNYMGELGKLHYRGANALATALQSRLWDIQNRYAGRLMNSGRTEIAGVYAAQGQELYHLIEDVKDTLRRAQEKKEEKKAAARKGSGSRDGYSSGSDSSWGSSSRYHSFVKRAVDDAPHNAVASGSDYKKTDAGTRSGSILRLRNLIPRAQLPYFFDI
ncbi:hypothetical protein ACKVWC_005486 [Pyricularia oryzae]